MDLLEENLKDNDCRYFMLISKGNIGVYILDNMFKKQERPSLVIIGSKFPEDINNEEYILRTISYITDTMEKGALVMMQNLDQIYPSLYDLFNQNFTIIQNRKNCRIALGSTYNLFYVEESFKAFVLLEEKELPEQEAPFLNRFEKQIVNISDVLNEKQREISNFLIETFDNIFKIVKQTIKSDNMQISHYIINYCRNELEGMTFKYSNENLPDNLRIQDLVLYEILSISSFDLILVFVNNHNIIDKEKYIQIYLSQNHNSLNDFLKNRLPIPLKLKKEDSLNLHEDIIKDEIEVLDINKQLKRNASQENKEEKENEFMENQVNIEELVSKLSYQSSRLMSKHQFSKKFLIYTFSHIYQKIDLDVFQANEIQDFFIGEFKSEKEVLNVLKFFLENKEKKVMIMSLAGGSEEESQHLSHLKFLIENKLNAYDKENPMKEKIFKTIIIIVHLEKELIAKANMEILGYSKFSFEWESIMIDNLSPLFNLDLNFSLKSTLSQILHNEKMIDINELIITNLPFVIKSIKYRDEIIWREGNLFIYFKDLVENLSKNPFFFQIIKEKLILKAKQNDNWQEILINLQKNVKYKSLDMMSGLLSLIIELLEDVLLNFFYNIETFSALDSFAFKSNNEKIQDLFQRLMEIEINRIFEGNIKLLNATGGNEISEKIWGLNYPFFMLYFNKIEKEINMKAEVLNELDKKISQEIIESSKENYNDFEKIPELKGEKEKILEKTIEIIINEMFSHEQDLKDALNIEFSEVSAILIEDLMNCYMQKHFRIFKNFEKTQKLLLKSLKYLCPMESFPEIWIFLATKKKLLIILLNIFDHLYLDINLYEYCLENIENLKRNDSNPEENWTLLINLVLKCYFPNLFIYKNIDFIRKYSKILEGAFSDIYSLFIELDILFVNRNVLESLKDFVALIYTTECGVLEEELIKDLAELQLNKENRENNENNDNEDIKEEEIKLQIPNNFDIFQNDEIRKYIVRHIKLIKEKYKDVKAIESPLRELYYFHSMFLFAIFEENEKNPDEEARLTSVKFVLNEIFSDKDLLPFCVKTIEDILGGQVPMQIPEDSEDLSVKIYQRFCENNLILNPLEDCLQSLKNKELDCFMIDIIITEIKSSNGGMLRMNKNFTKFAEQSLCYLNSELNNDSSFEQAYNLKILHRKLARSFSIAFIKLFNQEMLDIVMHPNDNLEYLGFIKDLERLFANKSEVSKNSQLHFLKELKNSLGSIQKLKDFDFENKSLEFLVNTFPALKPNNENSQEICDYEAFEPKTMKYYKNLQKLFELAFSGLENPEKIMLEFKVNYKDSDFILAFMDLLLNKCLIKHYHNSKNSRLFIQKVNDWIISNKNSFIQLLGENFYSVILSYCENKASILDQNDPKTKNDLSNQIQFLIFANRVLNILFSLGEDPKTNPYFFLIGKIKELEAINNCYISGIGDGINSLQLRKKHEAYLNALALYKNKARNGIAHVYMCDCFYIYEVQPCGWFHLGMDQNGLCPSCGKSIGFKPPNAAIEKREGHFIILTPIEYDQQLKTYTGYNPSFVAETPRKFVQDMENELKVENQNASKKGYERIFEQNFDIMNYTLRNLTPIGTRTYSFIIHSVINALYQNGKISENELKVLMTEKNNEKQNLNPENEALKYLWQIMRKEFFVLKSLVPKNLEAQSLPVLMIILNTFRAFLSKSGYLADKNLRESLENQTNMELEKLMKNLENEIRDYMTSSAEARSVKPTDIFSIIDEVNIPNEMDTLFRFSKMGSSKDLRLHVEMPNLPNSKYLVNFFNFIPELLLMKHVYPIIDFINQVLVFYKMKIDRSRSKEYKIRDFLTNVERKEAFQKFQESWENFIQLKGFIWQLECHPLEPKASFKEDDDLAFVLVDKKELGFGMYIYVLFNNIINIQNRILNELNKNQLKMEVENKVILQKASESQLLGISEQDLQSIENTIMRNSSSNLEYGKGGLICYNIQNLNNFIYETLFKGKKLLFDNEEAIICMQYQYEMIPNTLLSQLSEKIQQKPLYEKDAFIHKIELQSIPDIPIFFQNLELLIYLMVNVNENEVQKLKENKISSFIENLPQNFKIDDSFIDYCKRQEILVKNLVSFFEIVELFTYYRKILEKLSSDYQEELSKKEIEDLEKFCLYLSNENNDNKIILNQSNVADAIRRYICRNLIGSNLSSTHKLGDFLGVDNLWPEKIFIESEKVLVMFPESITFKFAVAAQKFLRTKDEVELIEKKANNLQKKNEKKQVAQPIKQVPKIGVNRKR